MFLREFLMMLRFGSFLWVSLWGFTLSVLGCISKYVHRLKSDHVELERDDANFGAVHPLGDDQIAFSSCSDLKSDGFGEKEKDANFQDSPETEDSAIKNNGVVMVSSESKYQFLFSKNVSGFIMEPKMFSFTVEEMFVNSNDGCFTKEILKSHSEDGVRVLDENSNNLPDIDDDHFTDEEGLQEHTAATDVSEEEEESDVNFCVEEKLKGTEEATSEELGILEDDADRDISGNSLECQVFSYKLMLPRDQSSVPAGEPDSESWASDVSVTTHPGDTDDQIGYEHVNGILTLETSPIADEILITETSTSADESKPEKTAKTDEGDISTWCRFNGEAILSRKGEEISDDDYIELEPHLQSSTDVHEEKSSLKDVMKFEETYEHGYTQELEDGLQNFEEQNLNKSSSWDSDSDGEDEFDILQEHKHLVQQMKMEMRYSKVKGLPTISEECESPKTVDDLKPLRIDEKFEFKDCMAEIQKFYRSYADKMKKLDILNYQTLHAISLLQLKDSEVFMAGQKSPFSLIKPFIPKFWPCKLQRIYADSTHKFINEAHRDLELVYTGQVCHSWEILSWQYAKAKELLENDSQGHRSYTKAASEFQQFQVLMERFVEDEPFQGPRIQHYVRNRCILRSFLQVPMIKDDCMKDRKGKEEEEEEENMISIAVLAEIIKESMQVFWEFLSSEKGETKMASKAAQETQVDVHDPADAKLLMDIKLTLQQKERRLKDILRSRNCIVKKFKRSQKGGQNHALFTSQVELKLVSRVLNLSRITTDQLMWCQRKLDNISFLGRKVQVEPSFWLFPC